MIWLLLACADAPQDSAVEVLYEPLDAPRLLRRASLDLRGTLPSSSELDRVRQDPQAYAELLQDYLADPAFEPRMVELLNERWWTRLDEFGVVASDYGIEESGEFEFNRSIGEEPLRLMAHVIAQDMPWTEVVTADWTLSNEVLASVWPLEREAGEGWQRSTYTDGRPPVGVLASNGLWWRYTTTESNMNRSRASAISRLLLCTDYLGRPIIFSEGEEVVAVEDAVKNDPYCLACHATIDPLAANLFGFWWLSLYSRVESETYHAEREALAMDFLGVEPGYFGQPLAGLSELGWAMTQDPRYYSCAVESTAQLLWRRPIDAQDRLRLEPLRQDFVADGAHMQALILNLMQTPEYQAAPNSQADGVQDLHMLSPSQLETVLHQLSGFVWTERGYAQLQNDYWGYRILAGGVDGYAVTEPQSRPGLPWVLVTKRAAQVAAAKTMRMAEQGVGLLAAAPLEQGTQSADFELTVRRLYWQLMALEPTQDELDSLGALWDQVNAEQGPSSAWEVVYTVMLRDPRFLTY